MSVSVQESLLDMGGDGAALGPLQGSVRRTPLTRGAWVDFCPGWLAGSAEVFAWLVESVPWRAEQRPMYDRVVAVPRLQCFYGEDTPLPHPVLTAARQGLDEHYRPELGEPFRTAGLCLYRDGRDSVAWHGDTSGRDASETVVAIVSLGTPRALLLRSRTEGDPARRYVVGHGDLLVMGGTCQRTWQHAMPKTTRAAGPRISVQFRPAGIH